MSRVTDTIEKMRRTFIKAGMRSPRFDSDRVSPPYSDQVVMVSHMLDNKLQKLARTNNPFADIMYHDRQVLFRMVRIQLDDELTGLDFRMINMQGEKVEPVPDDEEVLELVEEEDDGPLTTAPSTPDEDDEDFETVEDETIQKDRPSRVRAAKT